MNLTLDELKSTGVGKFMNVLSKTHSNARIKEAANTLVTSWRSMMSAVSFIGVMYGNICDLFHIIGDRRMEVKRRPIQHRQLDQRQKHLV